MKYSQTGNPFHPSVIVPVFVIFLTSTSIVALLIFILKKAVKYSPAKIRKLIIPSLLVFYFLVFIISNLTVALGVFGWYLLKGLDLTNFWPHLFRQELSFANGSLFMWMMFFSIAFFYILWQKTANKEQKLIEDNLKYRYNTLKSQVNPHFLFNSLNTLSELVYTDAKKSDSYIQTLSGIYRYVLENEEIDLVELEQELEFVKQYFSLQQVRDEGKIVLEIDIKETSGIKIIPVSLQLLLENALKHNVVSHEKPLVIKIFLENDYIVVSNPLQKKSILESSTQIGLSSLKDRVKIILGSDMEIDQQDKIFTVKLPIQKLQ